MAPTTPVTSEDAFVEGLEPGVGVPLNMHLQR